MENKEYLNAASRNSQALIDITASKEAWLSFLWVAGHNFGLPVEAQLAIWQRDKTAVAAMSKEKWIKLGYEPIPDKELFVVNGSEAIPYYLLNDVLPTEKSKEIPLWYVDYKDYSEIAEIISNKYQLPQNEDFIAIINTLANKISNDSNIEFKELFSNSIKDTILQRCGLDPICEYNVKNIPLSDLLSILNRLNSVNRDIIGTLRSFSLKNKKSIIYTFDNGKINTYNQSVINTEGEDENGRHYEAYSNSERRGRNGSRIGNSDNSGRTSVLRESGRVSNSVAGIPEENKETSERNRAVRKNEMGISQREPSTDADRNAPSGAEKRIGFGGLSGESERGVLGESSSAFFRYNEERRNNGTSGHGLVEVCSGKIQRSIKSKGNAYQSNGLQLTFFNNRDETAGLDENNPTVFVYNNFEKLLLQGTGVVDGKFRVFNHFTENSNKKSNPQFLKKEFGDGGGTFILTDDSRGFYDSTSKGLLIKDSGDNTVLLSWNDTAAIIDLLVKADLYLSDEEKDKYKQYLEKENNKEVRSKYISKVVSLMDYDTDVSKSIKDYYKAVRVNQSEFINNEKFTSYLSNLDEKSPNEIIYRFLQLVSKSNMNVNSQAKELLMEFKDFAPECFENSIINEYFNLLQQYPDKLLLIQVGSFFEAMGSNAKTFSEILNLELTSRMDENGVKIPLIGIPENRLEEYVDKVISNNKDVVIATVDESNSVGNTYNIVSGERTVAVSDSVEVQTPDEIILEEEKQTEAPTPRIVDVNYFAKGIPQKTRANTNTHRNFLSLLEIAPMLLNNQISYIRLSSGEGFMPLTIEKIGNHRISVSHHYVQNGDIMYDPEIVYYVNEEKQELRPREYRQDNLGIYQTVENDNGNIDMVAEAELSKFTIGWFNNIKSQGYLIERAIYDYQSEDIDLYFNSDKQLCRIGSNLSEQFCKENNIALPEDTLKKAFALLDKYNHEEFGYEGPGKYEDLTNIGLAFTTTEDDKHEIQAIVNLEKFTLERYVDNRLIEKKQYNSLDDIIQNELESISFEDLVYVDDDTIAHIENSNDYEVPQIEINGSVGKNKSFLEPVIYCEWSESATFSGNVTYSFDDFNNAMKVLDNAAVKLKSEHPDDITYQFYDKVKYTIILPSGKEVTERQDIGDGDGSVIDFLSKFNNGLVQQILDYKNSNEQDRFFINRENHTVNWLYFNPNSSEGGQYVENIVTFEQVKEASESCKNPKSFFETLEMYATQHLGDVGTEFFSEYDEIYHSGQHFQEGRTFDVMNTLIQNSDVMYAPKITGEEVSLDEKDFVVDVVNALTGDALLIETSDNLISSSRYVNTDIVQNAVLQKKQNDITSDDTSNYQITDDEIGVGTKSERYAANVNAIRTLKNIEKDNRIATKAEQDILSKYVGWGGLSDVFDERHSKYNELRSLLNEYEYSVARASTLTAFYTPPIVIRSIYTALQNMGLKDGRILEPSCGVGNFFGLLPDELSGSRLNGVEIDSISGRIAKQLYPKVDISICGFEETSFENDTFDAVVGNVPFGQFKVRDRDYDKNNFLIHDYFFAKALDKVKPGGVVAFITSKGTMDKSNSSVRKYIAKRAELLGAVRLPDNTFKSAAGTEVTSDIVFLQKRPQQLEIEPEWVHLGQSKDGIILNDYFVQNPDMILGNMEMVTTAHGMDSACKSNGKDLAEQLSKAIKSIKGEIVKYDFVEKRSKEELENIPIIDGVKNMAYAIIDNKVYQRNDNSMKLIEASDKTIERYKGLVSLNKVCQDLISVQADGETDEVIREHQNRLNSVYDDFVKKFGRINSRTNNKLFCEDPGYPLLTSLEKYDNNGEFKSKSDMFFIRTIRPLTVITQAQTSNDALIASLSNKGFVDMDYMIELTGLSSDKIEKDLRNVIFRVPSMNPQEKPEWVTADEYLSGNVKEKLNFAKLYAGVRKEEWINDNIEALTNVQPKPLTAAQIKVRLGATWVPSDIIDDFMYYLLKTRSNNRKWIVTNYSDLTGAWRIENKTWEAGSVASSSVYGTRRVHGYQLLEDCLNLKNTVVKDLVEEDGKEKYVINEKETKIAQSKQKQIRKEFDKWIWNDITRRKRLEDIYNNKFNSSVVRKYDGSYLSFEGANCNITFRPHQKDAVARILYGNNTLLDHCVGAGKSYVMIAAAMEAKRLGLCHKSIIAVPNNIVGQMASDFMELYPSANILMATEKDFSKMNRKKFCSRIATGDYDAIIMGHSQFEKIPLSKASQIDMLNRQLDEVLQGIADAGASSNKQLTVKALEKSRRSLETRLKNLNDIEQDDTITFEQLGVDKLFVDEAHNFKNLFLYTKMGNVAGINTTESKKATDMYNKVRWLDEHTNNKGTVFATGTPVSNTMAELYTMQRYLQYDRLKQLGLLHFDSWASSFGETVTELELKPEGTGFRLKERFAKFFNVPELMNIFREVADIKTKEMLDLPVPKVHYENIVCPASDIQKAMVDNLAERAEKVRDGVVEPNEDNMLLITSDGRKLALDQRIIDSELPDDSESKVNHCVEDVYSMWKKTAKDKLTQLIFCDLSTPNSKEFNVYDDIKAKLISKGIPENEIAFVHDATTNTKKEKLFSKVRDGDVRVLLGSTQKCGTGTNVQDKLIATYDLDCPWRPADLEQRSGRIERQGNQNSEVYVYRYVTEGTFDAYMYQLVEKKQRFISQIMQGDTSIREIEDLDESSLNYAKLKALAVGDPLIQEKMELELQVRDLLQQKQNHNSEIFALQDKIAYQLPKDISNQKSYIESIKSDMEVSSSFTETSPVIVSGVNLIEPKDIGIALKSFVNAVSKNGEKATVGTYRGLEICLYYDSHYESIQMKIGKSVSPIRIGSDATTIGKKLLSSLDNLEVDLVSAETKLDMLENELVNAKEAVLLPFPAQAELDKKQNRLEELDAAFEEKEKIKQPQRTEFVQ